jgi:hypothetical protein
VPFAQTPYDPYAGLENIGAPPSPYVAGNIDPLTGLSILQVDPLLATSNAGLSPPTANAAAPASPFSLFTVNSNQQSSLTWQGFFLIALGIWALAVIVPAALHHEE